MADGEEEVVLSVLGCKVEEAEALEGRGKELDICALLLLVSFGPGYPHVGLVEEDISPPEEEYFFGPNKRVEGEGEEGVVVQLKESEALLEEEEVFDWDPDWRFGELVEAAVGLETE